MANIRVGNNIYINVRDAVNRMTEIFGLSENNAFDYLIAESGFSSVDVGDAFAVLTETIEQESGLSSEEYLQMYLNHSEAEDIEFEEHWELKPVEGIWELL